MIHFKAQKESSRLLLAFVDNDILFCHDSLSVPAVWQNTVDSIAQMIPVPTGHGTQLISIFQKQKPDNSTSHLTHSNQSKQIRIFVCFFPEVSALISISDFF